MKLHKLYPGKQDLWNPYHIPRSIIRAWWCADDHDTALMTDVGGGLISSWRDRIHALEVTTPVNDPVWGAAQFNGAYAGIQFADNSDYFLMAALDSRIPSGSDDSTIIVVCDPGVVGSAETPISYGANGNATRRQIIRRSTGSGSVVQANDNSVNYDVQGLVAWTTPSQVVAYFQATALQLFQDGTSIGVDADGSLNTTATKLVIGANAATSPAGFFGGPIRHIMILAGSITTALRQQLEGYFAWDSGLVASLPSTHPYKLAPP